MNEMNKQKEIKEGIGNKVESQYPGETLGQWRGRIADKIRYYLHSQGVVIKVEKKLSSSLQSEEGTITELPYVMYIPLIELCPKCGKEGHLCKCPTINCGSFAKYVEPLVGE